MLQDASHCYHTQTPMNSRLRWFEHVEDKDDSIRWSSTKMSTDGTRERWNKKDLLGWCQGRHEKSKHKSGTTTTNVLRPLFRDHPSEPVPEENFWTLWCKRILTEADTPTIRLGATPSGLTSAHLHHPPIFFTGGIAGLPPKQQRQSTKSGTNRERKSNGQLADQSSHK